MATNRTGQFDYPEKPWSEGKMRTAKRDMRDLGGKEFRELEGVKRERVQRLSQNMTSAIPGEANIGTAAGAISGPGSQVIGAMEKILQGQQQAQGIESLSAAEKKKRGLHPDNLSDDQLLQQYQQGIQQGQPVVLHGSKREMELYMRALDPTQGGG